jgi:flavodoxin
MSAATILAGAKVLICWYSKSGMTKRVVDVLAKQLGDRAVIYEVKTDIDYQGFGGTVKVLWHAVTGRAKDQHIVGETPSLSDFGTIVIAGPVWGYKVSSPIAKFLSGLDFEGKPVIPLATCESNMAGYLDDMAPQIKNGQYIRKDGFYGVKKETDESLAQKVTKWMQSD